MEQDQKSDAADAPQAGSMEEHYVLRLFVTGMSPRSGRALAVVKQVCADHLPGRYDLEVIDIYQQPALAREEGVFAAPALVRKYPKPVRRLTGNLAEPSRVLAILDLQQD